MIEMESFMSYQLTRESDYGLRPLTIFAVRGCTSAADANVGQAVFRLDCDRIQIRIRATAAWGIVLFRRQRVRS